MMMTFNDLVLPTPSSSASSEPLIVQTKSLSFGDQAEVMEESGLEDNPRKSQNCKEHEDLLAGEKDERRNKTNMDEASSSHIGEIEQMNKGIENGNRDLETGNEIQNLESGVSENRKEDLEPAITERSKDNSTFTVSSNTTLVEDSQASPKEMTLGSLDLTLEGSHLAPEEIPKEGSKHQSQLQLPNATKPSSEVVVSSSAAETGGAPIPGKDLIADTVRSEMKEILQLQHQQLLTLLKAVEAKSSQTGAPSVVDCTTQIDVASHTVETKISTKSQKSHDSLVKSHDVQMKSHDSHPQSQDPQEQSHDSSSEVMPVSLLNGHCRL